MICQIHQFDRYMTVTTAFFLKTNWYHDFLVACNLNTPSKNGVEKITPPGSWSRKYGKSSWDRDCCEEELSIIESKYLLSGSSGTLRNRVLDVFVSTLPKTLARCYIILFWRKRKSPPVAQECFAPSGALLQLMTFTLPSSVLFSLPSFPFSSPVTKNIGFSNKF